MEFYRIFENLNNICFWKCNIYIEISDIFIFFLIYDLLFNEWFGIIYFLIVDMIWIL